MTERAHLKRAAKRISLTPDYRAVLARKIIEPADALAERITGSEPRPGSMVDIENFSKFARILRNEISVAVSSGGLEELLLKLPTDLHLARAIIKRTVYPEGAISSKIPGVALVLTPSEEGWTGFFAGENHVKRIKKDPSNQEETFREAVLDCWKRPGE